MRQWTFEVKETADDQWMFNLKSGNGEIVATSERYTRKQSALKTIKAIRAGALFAKVKTRV